jgi:multiple sugar transport system permease protein
VVDLQEPAAAGGIVPSPPSPRRDDALRRRSARTGMLLTVPALAALAATIVYPVAHTIWLSLHARDYAMTGKGDFVGLANYVRIGLSADFLAALVHTLGFVVAALVLEALIALPVALALDRGLRGTRVFRAVIALPLMVAPVVGALAWRWMFADAYGVIDSALAAVGADGPLWFSDIWLARATIVIANLWLALPFDILMLVAGLASLPREPLEAAEVDGASYLQRVRLVVLPLLRPVIAIILVVRFADAFRIFDVVYVLTGSGPANATDVLSTFIYRQMFSSFDFAGGAAASIILVIVTTIASLGAIWALRARPSAR